MSNSPFLELLKKPECVDLTIQLKNFISASFAQPKPIPKQRRLTSLFLEKIVNETIQNPIFKELCDDEEGLMVITEGWEKLVLTKLHDLVFGAPMTEEPLMCAHFDQKLTQFSWVQERHLDLMFETNLEVAEAELVRLSNFRAPKDKLTILNNTMQIVVDLIHKSSDNKAGNDQILPVLVLLLLRSKPPKMISHIRYILRFRNQMELQKGINQYCMTNMMGAISFIYNMSPTSLTLSSEEKSRYVAPSISINTSRNDTPEISEVSPLQQNSPLSQKPQVQEYNPPSIQIGDLASQVFQSTSGFLGHLFKEVKNVGDKGTIMVDELLDSVLGPVPTETVSTTLPNATSTNLNYPGIASSSKKKEQAKMKKQGSLPNFQVFNNDRCEEEKDTGNKGLKQSPSFPSRNDKYKNGNSQEDYELELAIALSLSTVEQEKTQLEESLEAFLPENANFPINETEGINSVSNVETEIGTSISVISEKVFTDVLNKNVNNNKEEQ
ncbi:hypothetical protein HDU92_007836 [Lobulomyces angularis]|nr:hypothetical protein HDU92_007836 [Lobulomyces angularis]